MNSGIYEIVNTVNGHRYIGSAMNIPQRWSQHKSNLIKNKHHSRHLQNAWNKYGADCFDFRVVEYCFFFMLIPREQHYIDDLRPEYNIAPVAGSCIGVKRSDETKAKMSVWQIGRKRTPEEKANMSAGHIGKKLSPETKANMSAGHMGNKNLLGHKHSDETKAKLSAAGMGKKPSPETKVKLSAWQIGKKLSPETKAKISAAHIAAWAKRRLQKESTHADPV